MPETKDGGYLLDDSAITTEAATKLYEAALRRVGAKRVRSGVRGTRRRKRKP